MTSARVSQDVAEVEVVGSPKARVSQDVAEPLVVGSPKVRVSQDVVEPLIVVSPRARVSQDVAEPLITGLPHLRVSLVVVEALIANIEVGMLPVYPTLPGLAYNVKWSPRFANMKTEVTSSLAEIDLALAAYPVHDFELTYEFLRDRFGPATTEFRTMMGFFLRMGGNVGRFLFRNPDDYQVVNQSMGTTDGVTSNFHPILRTFGDGANSGSEPVGFVDLTSPFNVYLDGVKQDPDSYSVVNTTPGDCQLKFNTTPATGKKITVDMAYMYYCKFSDPGLTFEKFMDRLWTVQTVKLHSCRANA